MNDYCAYDRNHKCKKWTELKLAFYELEEANELCHENWIEIQRKEQYISTLQELLKQNNISYPADEWAL